VRTAASHQGGGTAQGWSGLFGHAMERDHTKSRRIHAFDGSGVGKPTGLVVSNVRPSVPSLFTEDTAWQLMHDDCVSGVPTFSPSMIEFPNSLGLK
jgi:hypothetical protein